MLKKFITNSKFKSETKIPKIHLRYHEKQHLISNIRTFLLTLNVTPTISRTKKINQRQEKPI